MTTRRFDSKAAIVTGGARGIGFATALRLAKEGASVAVFDLDSEVFSPESHRRQQRHPNGVA